MSAWFLTFALIILVGVFTACRGPGKASWERLEPGMRVEAEGPPAVPARAIEIQEKERGLGDSLDRFEITGPIEELNGDIITVIGREVHLTADTEFEDEQKTSIERPALSPGTWVKIKAKTSTGDVILARTVRLSETRPRFQIEGDVRSVSEDPPEVTIGAVTVDLDRGTDVERLRGRNRSAELAAEGSPLALFQQDEQKGVPFTMQASDDLYFGGQFELDVEHKRNYDVNNNRDRDDTDLTGSAKGDLLWGFDDEGSFVLFEVSARHLETFAQNDDNETDRSLLITRAFGYWKMSEEFRLQAGRQDFDEEREWLYDDRLDALRVHYQGNALEAEVAVGSGRDILEYDNPQDDIVSFIAVGRYRFDDDHHLSTYLIDRRDQADADFSPFLYGLRSWGRPSRGLRHWAELSRADGVDGPLRIDGYAVDLGLGWACDSDLRPSLTVGWALGTGDRDSDDNRGAYRQSGLHDNNGKFGGVTSFRYYGEIFDPELTNLEVLTLAVGVRPMSSFSIDVVGHTYRQDVLSIDGSKNGIKRAPTGESRDLGYETDLVIGYRFERSFDLELIVGRFDPGRAYDTNDAAWLGAVQARYKF